MAMIRTWRSVATEVAAASDVGEARRRALFLLQHACDEDTCARVALVVTEAATNLVKHAGSGEIVVTLAEGGGATAVEILSLDRGPGIADVQASLRDGYSTAGSPGTGLGAIRRASQQMALHSRPQRGTALLARLQPRGSATAPVQAAAICVPYPGEHRSGDAVAVAFGGDRTSAFVVDGLGHGPIAVEAAEAAIAAFAAAPQEDPVPLMERVHAALRATRGAAAAVCVLDPTAARARWCGVGNIGGRIVDGGATRSAVSHSGIVGGNAPRIREFSYPLPPTAQLLMFSDGIATHWDVDEILGVLAQDPALLAGVIYRDHARRRDDATVLVVSEA